MLPSPEAPKRRTAGTRRHGNLHNCCQLLRLLRRCKTWKRVPRGVPQAGCIGQAEVITKRNADGKRMILGHGFDSCIVGTTVQTQTEPTRSYNHLPALYSSANANVRTHVDSCTPDSSLQHVSPQCSCLFAPPCPRLSCNHQCSDRASLPKASLAAHPPIHFTPPPGGTAPPTAPRRRSSTRGSQRTVPDSARRMRPHPPSCAPLCRRAPLPRPPCRRPCCRRDAIRSSRTNRRPRL